MYKIHIKPNLRATENELIDFLDNHKDEVVKYNHYRIPKEVILRNSDIHLFMDYYVFKRWSCGRHEGKDYEEILEEI